MDPTKPHWNACFFVLLLRVLVLHPFTSIILLFFQFGTDPQWSLVVLQHCFVSMQHAEVCLVRLASTLFILETKPLLPVSIDKVQYLHRILLAPS